MLNKLPARIITGSRICLHKINFITVKDNHDAIFIAFWVLAGIAILVVLNLKYKFHNVFSLLIAGMFVAIMVGIPSDKIVGVVQMGIGSIMGHLALIIIFGAIIGKFMTESGASQQIADTVIRHCGTRFLSTGLMFIGVISGIAMFYEVAFLIAMPLVMNIAKKRISLT